MIRKMLLDTGYIIENENLEKYIKIVTHPDTEGYVERHHILPVSYIWQYCLPAQFHRYCLYEAFLMYKQ